MKNFLYLFIVINLISCELVEFEDVERCKTHFIPKDSHYPEKTYKVLSNCDSRIEFILLLNSSMFYDPSVPGFVEGHNKITGIIANSSSNSRSYSARITWFCNNPETMNIGFIVHLPSLEDDFILGTLISNICLEDEIYCIVEDLNKDGFYFYAENLMTKEYADKFVGKCGAGNIKQHKLARPYFGGKEKAPHDIKIQICKY